MALSQGRRLWLDPAVPIWTGARVQRNDFGAELVLAEDRKTVFLGDRLGTRRTSGLRSLTRRIEQAAGVEQAGSLLAAITQKEGS